MAGGKKKQGIVIVDATATAPLTLWEDDIDRVIVGERYSSTNLIVKTFWEKKQLSVPKDGSIAIGRCVAEELSDHDSDMDPLSMQDVVITRVPIFSSHMILLL